MQNQYSEQRQAGFEKSSELATNMQFFSEVSIAKLKKKRKNEVQDLRLKMAPAEYLQTNLTGFLILLLENFIFTLKLFCVQHRKPNAIFQAFFYFLL